MFAQSPSSFEFVDSEGNIIPSGSTVVRDAATVSGFGLVTVYSEISIRTTSSSPESCFLTCSVQQIPSGTFQICGAGSCVTVPGMLAQYPASGDTGRLEFTIGAGATKDTESEWRAGNEGDYGSFNVKYSIDGGSEITVNFVYADPTGINSVQASTDKKVVGYYTIGGQRLDSQRKGINIIKYSDGTTEKKILK